MTARGVLLLIEVIMIGYNAGTTMVAAVEMIPESICPLLGQLSQLPYILLLPRRSMS